MGQPKKKVKVIPEANKASRRLFDYLPDVVVTVDRQQRVLFMSRAMEGAAPKRMVGRDSALLFPRGFRAWYRRSMGRLFKESEVDRFQYSTEQSVWWEVRLLPIQRGRKVVEAMILCSNITEKRVFHAQAIRHARLATIGVLAASVAHEINNPNSAIAFNAAVAGRIWGDSQRVLERYFQENGDFLLGGIPFSEARVTMPTLFEEMRLNSRRVEQIVAHLKGMTRHQEPPSNVVQAAWPVVPISRTVDLHATLEDTMMILNHKICSHTDCFQFLPGQGIPAIPGNGAQLEQVFINVVLNALQSLPSREKSVTVETILAGEQVQIVVKDAGVGIAPEHLTHLTEPFFTTRLEAGGTGLGLSISNLIVRQHRGSIHFQSVVGQGTTVTIALPVRQTEDAGEVEAGVDFFQLA